MGFDNNEDKYDYINPNHYKGDSMDAIDVMMETWGSEEVISFCKLNAFKYLSRAGRKKEQPQLRDYSKAKWYIEHIIKTLEKDAS